MTSRQGQGIWSELIRSAAVLPWWAALLLAVASYFACHALAGMAVPASEQPTAQHYVRTLATALQYVLPLLLVLAALLSVLGRRQKAGAEPQPSVPAEPVRQPPPRSKPIPRTGTSTYMACPKCGSMMYVRRAPEDGPDAGKPYWGCSRFPLCKATLEVRAAGD
ncbi:MAG: DNA topoisomerase I [Pseudomonadota bacterium]|nr:DNA topoisomerase I [Pseudomonadota bacterium]